MGRRLFGLVAKHRGTWPVRWLCAALGVSRSGFHSWLARPRRRGLPADAGTRVASAMAANLPDRQFTAQAPNQKWVAVVIDLFSRRVVG